MDAHLMRPTADLDATSGEAHPPVRVSYHATGGCASLLYADKTKSPYIPLPFTGVLAAKHCKAASQAHSFRGSVR